MKITKNSFLAAVIVALLTALSFAQTVPITERDMMGNEVQKSGTFNPSGTLECLWSFWDTFFALEADTTQDGDARWEIVKADGSAVTVAGFTLKDGVITYSTWHAGAAVWESSNQYNHFWEGQVINPAWKLHVTFDMSPLSPWAGCSQLRVVNSGGLKIIPISLVTNKKDCGACQIGNLPCYTIKMRTPQWWQTWGDLSRYRVRQFGMNFGAELPANTPIIVKNLRDQNDNGHAAAYQLQFQSQNVPPVNAGWPTCYGITFDSFTLSTGTVITDKTLCFDINTALKESIQRANAADFAALIPIIRRLNTVGN